LVSCANDIFFVAYGLWLVENFNMGLVALGLATTVIGLAELSGELLAVSLADRIGLRRTVLITLGATVLCYAFLPLWGFSVTGALIGIFLLCLAFEFNFVAMISWTTEVYPTARATMMSSFQAASGLGHVCGVVTGGLIWLTGGIAGVGIVCAALCALGFIVIHRELHYRELHLREQHQYHQLPVAHRAKSSSKSGHRTAAEVVVHYQAWCQHVW
jgi:predicted MFS family arabinose efflux permease